MKQTLKFAATREQLKDNSAQCLIDAKSSISRRAHELICEALNHAEWVESSAHGNMEVALTIEVAH